LGKKEKKKKKDRGWGGRGGQVDWVFYGVLRILGLAKNEGGGKMKKEKPEGLSLGQEGNKNVQGASFSQY